MILSRNHREIDIAELILVSIKLIIKGVPNNDILDIMATSLTARGVEHQFFGSGGSDPLQISYSDS